MLSNHTQDLITAAKAKPNGLWRNKAVSALQSALAAFKMLEDDEAQAIGIKRPGAAANGLVAQNIEQSCNVCPAGAIDKSCPVHGEQARRY